MKYLEVIAEFKNESTEIESLNTIALKEYDCDGVHEYSLEEDEIDNLLGPRSYGGGNPPSEIFDEIEEHSKKDQIVYAYCFSENHKEQASSWMNFLSNQSFITKVDLIEKPYEDWNEKWREHYEEIEIAEDFSIIPSWQNKGNLYLSWAGFWNGSARDNLSMFKAFLPN